jgi:hypothetical protein
MFSVLAVTAIVSSMSPTATVTGVVRDSAAGLPLVGATVTVSSTPAAVTTDVAGRFMLSYVRTGVQHMTVRCLGHTALTLDIVVPSDGLLRIDLVLASTPTRLASVDVFPSRALREPLNRAGATLGARTFDAVDVARHPLLSEPDLFRALSGGSVAARAETAGALYVNGGRSDQVAYSIDGMPVFNPAHLGGLISGFNSEALADAELSIGSPVLAGASVLSGSLAATTRSPGDHASVRGALSSSHARLTVDGPLGVGSAAYLVSARQAVPRLGSVRDPNFLHGESGDWFAKVATPVSGGALTLSAYGSGDELSARRATVDAPIAPATRNGLAWQSSSLGAQWLRTRQTGETRVNVWQAGTSASADWGGDSTRTTLDSRRNDIGFQIFHRISSQSTLTSLALRLDFTQTAYKAASLALTGSDSLHISGVTPVATLSADRRYDTRHNLQLTGGAALATSARGLYFLPRARMAIWPTAPVSIAIDASRSVQFVQSLRNEESLVSHIFPVELYVGAGNARLPVATSDQISVSTVVRPADGLRVSIEGHARRARGVLLRGERESGPFAVTDLARAPLAGGTVEAHGVSTEFAYTSSRAIALFSYGWQAVAYREGVRTYVPEHSARHLVEGGVTLLPGSGFNVRVGALGALGRRATMARGAVEWDGCSLADRACEFAGAPASSPDALGATRLPYYLRADLSVRKSWSQTLHGRVGELAVYGTVTNIFNRTNFLSVATVGDQRSGLEMRSRSPLVIGIDWRF